MNNGDKLSLLVLCLEIVTCSCANLYKSKLDKNTKIPLTRILFSSTLRKALFTVFSENLKLKSFLVSSKMLLMWPKIFQLNYHICV